MIIVFDSSVWVSAIQFGGVPLQSLDLATDRSRIAVSEPILSEVYSILMRKFGWRKPEIDETFEEYALDIFTVEFTGALHGICPDPKDDMVLECAESSGADLIVTGDKDLLAVSEYEGIRILTPRAFLDELAG